MTRGYVSPVFLPEAGACLSCLMRRFRGISPAPELYEAVVEHARQGRRVEPVPFPEEAARVLCELVRWKLAHLADREPPAALYRLHVLEVESMEVSSHRVLADPECPHCGAGG
jgi:bacteriocin biosynthesis cyclodehydratase domain-containing protein